MEKFLLIDGAMAYQAMNKSKYFASSGAPWFASLMPYAELCLAGPVLVARSRMEPEPKPGITAEVQRLAGIFPNRQHFSFIDSKHSFEELAEHLRAFVYFCDSTGEPYGLRIADNRVLSYLPGVLTTAEWDAMTALMEGWQVHDRTGRQHELPLNATRYQLAGAPELLTLSDEQIERLIDAGEPDALLARLNLDPENVAKGDVQKYYAIAKQCVAKWQATGSTDRNALLIFGRKIFASDGAVLGDPARVQQLLRSAIAAVQ